MEKYHTSDNKVASAFDASLYNGIYASAREHTSPSELISQSVSVLSDSIHTAILTFHNLQSTLEATVLKSTSGVDALQGSFTVSANKLTSALDDFLYTGTYASAREFTSPFETVRLNVLSDPDNKVSLYASTVETARLNLLSSIGNVAVNYTPPFDSLQSIFATSTRNITSAIGALQNDFKVSACKLNTIIDATLYTGIDLSAHQYVSAVETCKLGVLYDLGSKVSLYTTPLETARLNVLSDLGSKVSLYTSPLDTSWLSGIRDLGNVAVNYNSHSAIGALMNDYKVSTHKLSTAFDAYMVTDHLTSIQKLSSPIEAFQGNLTYRVDSALLTVNRENSDIVLYKDDKDLYGFLDKLVQYKIAKRLELKSEKNDVIIVNLNINVIINGDVTGNYHRFGDVNFINYT